MRSEYSDRIGIGTTETASPKATRGLRGVLTAEKLGSDVDPGDESVPLLSVRARGGEMRGSSEGSYFRGI